MPELSTIYDYMRCHAALLGDRILKEYPALHQFDDGVSPRIEGLLRTPFPAQSIAIMGVAKRWQQARTAMVVAECGTGKTLISLGAMHVHHQRSPFTALAMVPPHLVEKWAREAFLTLPGLRVFLIDDLRNGGDENKSHGVNEVRLRQGRIVREGVQTTLSELRLRKDSPSSRKRWLSLCGRPSLFIVGRERAKPGLTLAQAQTRLTAMAAQLRHDFPTDYPPQAQWTIEIQPLQETLVGKVRPMLLVLLGAVILIVFIVSLNIANLLLARASGRQQEMAVRSALGASRGRMVRQMLTESMLLSLIGGAAGIATAVGTLGFILRLVPSSVPRLSEVRIDWVVLAFALLISILTGLVFGLAPALHSAKGALYSAIREGGRGSGYSTKTGRLMVGAGLLLRTLRDLLQENPGFNPTQVVTANIQLPNPNESEADPYLDIPRRATFDRELLRRMKAIPGVELAAITSALPTTNTNPNAVGGIDIEGFAIEDRPVESSQDLSAERIRISSDYFKVLQTTLLRGRSFTEGDEDGKPLVAIIDESTARKYWPTQDPLGRRVRFARDHTKPWTTVVGIVKDIKSDGLDIDGVPHIYVSTYQDSSKRLSVVLRTSLPATLLEPQIRHEIQGIDPGLPVFNVSSMNDVLDRSLA